MVVPFFPKRSSFKRIGHTLGNKSHKNKFIGERKVLSGGMIMRYSRTVYLWNEEGRNRIQGRQKKIIDTSAGR